MPTTNFPNGVTADLIGNVAGNLAGNVVGGVLETVGAIAASGAVSVPGYSRTFFITKAGVAAMTIADPTATTHDGLRLTFVSTTAQAHTLTNTTGFGAGGASLDVATWGGAIGDTMVIVAYQGKWYVESTRNVTLA